MPAAPPPPSRWPSVTAFYAEDERRLGSKEVDFGAAWRTTMSEPPWRVSWIVATGELYATRAAEEPGAAGPVELLGRFATRREVEAALRNWPHMYGTAGSLAWMRERAQGRP